MLTPWKENCDQPRQHIKKQRHYFVNKGLWELEYKESWVLKNWCFWTVVLEKTLESPLNCEEIQPVHPKGDQSWVFIGRIDVEAETQYFGHLMQRADSSEKILIWERLRAGGEGNNRGWDGWMTSPIQWTWVWVDSRGWWWTGRPGVLRSMGSQRLGHNWVTELNWQYVRDYFIIIWWMFFNHLNIFPKVKIDIIKLF